MQVRRYLTAVKEYLAKLCIFDSSVLVLLGSAARGVRTWRSDIDLLVISERPLNRWRVSPEVHLHLETRDSFLDKLRSGDDFQAWAVRYGKLISDPSGWWRQLVASPDAMLWPHWQPKLSLAEKRLKMAQELTDMGDLSAAEEELLAAASHLARATLLRRNTFPLSRPELAGQLSRDANERKLASLISQLICGGSKEEDLTSAMKFLKSAIGQLKVAA